MNHKFGLALAADGNTLAVGAVFEDSIARGVGGDGDSNGAPDSGAVYVFAYDGSEWTEQAYIKSSNSEADDRFGSVLALSADGNTLAVGATGDDSIAQGVNNDESNNSAANSGER